MATSNWRSRRFILFTIVVLLCGMIGTGSVFAKTKLTVGTWLAPESFLQQYGEMAVFMEQNPDIELEVINIAAHGEYAAKILVLAATGSIPDVLMVPPEQVAPIVNAGILENLQPWMDNDGTLDAGMAARGDETMQFNDITFGMRRLSSTIRTHTTRYPQRSGIVPPAADSWVTWNQIRDIGRRSSVDVDGDGGNGSLGLFPWAYLYGIAASTFQAGGFIFDDDMLLNLDQPAMYEGVNWLLDLIDAKSMAAAARFYQSRVATMRLGSFEMTNIFNNQTPVAVTSGINTKPKAKFPMSSYTMTKQSQSKDAAWRYLKFLTSREAQQFVVERSRVPMRRCPYAGYKQNHVNRSDQLLGTAMGYPYHVNQLHSERCEQWYKRVWTREVTPAAAIPEIQRTVNAYLLDNR